MTQDWTGYEGRTAGAWRLASFLGFRDGRASFQSFDESIESPGEKRVVVQILAADDDSASAVGTSWDHASACSEDHLLRVYETGAADLDGMRVIYAAIEQPDIEIGEILAERPLNADEVRSLTMGAASALDYLHRRGLQHGSVTPFHMYVVGDAVKLSVDTISAAEGAGWESDMRRLGKTLIQTMTGAAKPDDPSSLPPPFRAIAAGCLGTGGFPWTAHRVLQTLSGNAMADPEKVSAPPVMRPVSGERPARQWIAITAGVAVLGFLGYWLVSTPGKTTQPLAVQTPVEQPAAVVPSQAQAPAEPAKQSAMAPRLEPAKPSAMAPRPGVSATRARTVPPPVERQSKGDKTQTGWAVIAATYANREAAQRRADQIAKHSSKLHPHVFTPASPGSLSYVVLGSGLTQDEAENLRRIARQAGAPQDSYVTKLKEN